MSKLEIKILSSKPVSWIREKSKTLILPGFEGVPLYNIFNFLRDQTKKIGFNERAAAISYNFIMALPAATIFIFTLIPYFPVAKKVQHELFIFIEDLSPDNNTRKLIMSTMDDLFNKPKTSLLSIGFILVIFYSSNAMMRIIRTFDRSLMVKRKENFLRLRFRAIQLTFFLIFVLLATILLSIGQGVVLQYLVEWMNIQNADQFIWLQLLRWVIIISLFLYSIAFIYKYAPSVPKRWKLISPGAVLATILIMLSTWLFSFWAQDFSNYNKIYGSMGAMMIIMLLVYVNSFMLLIGYEVNVSIHYLKAAEEKKIERKRRKKQKRVEEQ